MDTADKKKQILFLCLVIALYAIAIAYVAVNDLSWSGMFKAGLLQPKNITGLEARLTEIENPPLGNMPLVIWYIIIKGAALLVELLPYWLIGMLIAGSLVVFVSWEAVKKKMGYGGFKANLMATAAGSIIPICSCGIVPVLVGMLEAGVPLGPTLAFLIAAPMLNIPTVFMTAGLLGKKLALARVIGVFAIAMSVGTIVAWWQRRGGLKHLIKVYAMPKLSPAVQQFAYQIGMKLAGKAEGINLKEAGAENLDKLKELEEADIIEKTGDGRWKLVNRDMSAQQNACFVLPQGSENLTFGKKIIKTFRISWHLFLQLNYYLVLAVLIAGAIRVLIPTSLIVSLVGGKVLNSVFIASIVSVLAYVCTYVEVPTAMALIAKGMGPGATLAYLLGGPGLSIPAIMMLSAAFKKKLLVLYIALSFIGCVTAGYIFNLF
ncbi:permease [bacterium]|nr:permease [Candidatus Omnitrophota bacterium]MBU2527938.1 permease [bacterium]MBU3929292.1 permease [bacterium]MBU4122281.1 permease [bacterium]